MKSRMTKSAKNRTEIQDKDVLSFAKKVKKKRFEQEMTQQELAEKADFSVNYIGQVERAQTNPSLTTILKLARALSLSPKELMPDE